MAFLLVFPHAWHVLDCCVWLTSFLFDTFTKSSCLQVLSSMTITFIQWHLSQCFGVQGCIECYVWLSSSSFDTFTNSCSVNVPSMTIYVSNGVRLNVSGCVASIRLLCLAAFHPGLIPSPNLAAWRYHPRQFYVSNSVHIGASGCIPCIRLLCLSTVRWIALHYITFTRLTVNIILYICIQVVVLSLHCIALRCIPLHHSTLHSIASRYITLHCIALHYITLHSQHSRHSGWMVSFTRARGHATAWSQMKPSRMDAAGFERVGTSWAKKRQLAS